jgi:hypothetical protein
MDACPTLFSGRVDDPQNPEVKIVVYSYNYHDFCDVVQKLHKYCIVQDTYKWRALVNAIMNLRVP